LGKTKECHEKGVKHLSSLPLSIKMNWFLQKNETKEKNSSNFLSLLKKGTNKCGRKAKKVREFSNIEVMTVMRYLTMTTTPSAFIVKTCIVSPPNAGSHAPNVTIGSTTHVWVLTATMTRPSTTPLNPHLKFLRYLHILLLLLLISFIN
jgi:hypothetical protein